MRVEIVQKVPGHEPLPESDVVFVVFLLLFPSPLDPRFLFLLDSAFSKCVAIEPFILENRLVVLELANEPPKPTQILQIRKLSNQTLAIILNFGANGVVFEVENSEVGHLLQYSDEFFGVFAVDSVI